MTDSSDYINDMPDSGLRNHEVELILSGSTTGSEDLADVEGFVAVLSGETQAPQDAAFMATSLAALARSAGRPKKPLVRRLAPVAASVAALLALSGVAMAADNASPGDSLYGVDRVLERIGIADGGVDERIAEFDALLAVGEDDEAFSFLATYMESADESDAVEAQRHLELAATKADPDAAAAQQRVAALKDFIEQNRARGVGLDGRDFGQGVSDIARSQTETPAGSPDSEPGSPEDKGPPEDAGPPENSNQSEDAGPPEDPGPPEDHPGQADDPGKPDDTGSTNNTGPKGNEEPGPPDNQGNNG